MDVWETLFIDSLKYLRILVVSLALSLVFLECSVQPSFIVVLSLALLVILVVYKERAEYRFGCEQDLVSQNYASSFYKLHPTKPSLAATYRQICLSDRFPI